MSITERILFGAFIFGIIGLFTIIGIVTPGVGWFLYLFLIPFWAMFPIVILGVRGALICLVTYLIIFPVAKLTLKYSDWYQKAQNDMRTKGKASIGGFTVRVRRLRQIMELRRLQFFKRLQLFRWRWIIGRRRLFRKLVDASRHQESRGFEKEVIVKDLNYTSIAEDALNKIKKGAFLTVKAADAAQHHDNWLGHFRIHLAKAGHDGGSALYPTHLWHYRKG